MENFSIRFARALSENDVTQSELARRTGIPKSAVSQYLSGTNTPRLSRLLSLAETLNVHPAWLSGYDVDRNGQPMPTDLSASERQLLTLYRTSPDARRQLDEVISSCTATVFRAAKSENGSTAPTRVTVPGERLEVLRSADETDADL